MLFSSCSHESGARLQRLAILPPNILIGDDSGQWIGTALPLALEEDFATSPNLLAVYVRDPSSAYQFGATAVLRTTVERRRGQLHIQATLTDVSTQRNREVFELGDALSAGLLPLANGLAKRMDSGAASFSAKSERAFQTFAAALQSENLQARMQMLNAAIDVDPTFGLAYVVLAQTAAQANPQSLPTVLAKAQEHVKTFTPLDQARFNAFAAQTVHAPLTQQEASLEKLLQLAPNMVDPLAGLGVIKFLEGDAASGERLMTRALQLSPGNSSVRQQLARGLLENRRFAEAEKVFAALDNNPAVLPGLAVCVLLQGDLSRANTIINRFSQSLFPGVQGVYRAAWLALSGQTASAVAALQGARFADPTLQSAVLTNTVIWQLIDRDFAGARKTMASAAGPPGPFTPQAVLLSRADEPLDQWREQVQSSGLNAGQKQSLLAYGLFLAGHYAEAAQMWQQLDQRSGGADLGARAMLAGSLDRAGNTQAARKVLVQPFVPDFGDVYAAVSFGEMRRLLNLQVH